MKKRESVYFVVLFVAMVMAFNGGYAGRSGNLVMADSDATISGIVKDDAGKPLRGVRITATSGFKSVSRFSDGRGQYKITGLKPGSYDVSATALGYEKKHNTKELSGNSDMSFALSPRWDILQLSTADWLSALPENEDTLELRATCIKCHNLSWMVRIRGLTAPEWKNTILSMGNFGDVLQGRTDSSKDRNALHLSNEQAEKVAAILEKYFGPNAPLPTREQVHRPAISDAALLATFREYTVPTKSYVHSIKPDPEGKYVWFTEFDDYSRKFGRFDIAKEEFREIPLQGRVSGGSAWVGKDGRVWVSAGGKLVQVDASTGNLTAYSPPRSNERPTGEDGGGAGRPMAEDSKGNMWLAGGLKVTKFDPRTGGFERFPLPKVSAIPEDYYRNLLNVRSETQKAFGYDTYALTVDAHDQVWFSAYDVGAVGRLDPTTKEATMYPIPGALWIKGVAVDKSDNVWVGNFLHGTLEKLDPKTGQVAQYQPPTRYASFYTPVVDKKGNIWLSDFAGSQLTRFNPRTKQFTEYPLPEADGMVRFFGLDSQGRVWYTDFNGGKIGVLDPGDTTAP